MIFVCVGSRQYQFNRLFIKLDELVEKGLIEDEIFAQIGSSDYIPKHFKYKRYLSIDEFEEWIDKSEIVISHGGTGSIIKSLKKDKKVIAVSRLEKYGEHINDHQIQTNEAFAQNKYLIAIEDMDNLWDAIKQYKEGTCDIVKYENKDPNSIIKIIDKFIQENF